MAIPESIHVLIVEDDKYSTDILGGLLRRLHISYTSLSDGTKVVETMTQLDHIDVIFCDLELPQIDGYRVFKEIRAVNSDILIVAYTSHTNEMTHARQLGFNGFLSKPLNGRDFSSQLERILNHDAVWE